MIPALVLIGVALADSPLTSVALHTSYEEDPLVQRALEGQTLDARLVRFVLRGERALDRKVAVLSAVGWALEGRHESDILLDELEQRHKQPAARLLAQPELLEPAEALVLGYRLALDDYFHPEQAQALLVRARTDLPHSRTVALVDALVRSQSLMATDWCAVWTTAEAELAEPTLRPDLHFATEEAAIAYLRLYESSCEEEPTGEDDAPPADAPQNATEKPIRATPPEAPTAPTSPY